MKRKDEHVDSGTIINIGFNPNGVNTEFCYAHMNNPPGTAYRLGGSEYSIIKAFNSGIVNNGGRTATELYKRSGLSWVTASKAISKLMALKILTSKSIKGNKVYYINYKEFHFHSQHALILFNAFWKP